MKTQLLRSFDIAKDEHPVGFVIEKLSDKSIFGPLTTWILELLPTAKLPQESKMPVSLLEISLYRFHSLFASISSWLLHYICCKQKT